MTRVSSVGMQKRIYVVGDALLESETPEKLSLYLPDGTPIELGPDPTKMQWRGTWDAGADYLQNQVVRSGNSLYIFTGIDGLAGAPAPGVVGSDWEILSSSDRLRWAGVWNGALDYQKYDVVSYLGDLYTATGLLDDGEIPGAAATLTEGTTKAGDAMFGGHSQPAWIATKGVAINPVPAQLSGTSNVNFPGSKMIRVNAVPGDEVTLSWAGGSIYLFDGQHGDPLFFSPNPLGASIPASSSPLTFTVPAGTSTGPPDETTGGSGIGNLTVELDSAVTRFEWVDPEGGAAIWEKMVEASYELPAGGASGKVLAKASGTDRDVAWVDAHGIPAGGGTGKVLTKGSGADYDAGWVTPLPGLPSGGASGKILGKLSATDYDVGWVTDASGGGTSLPAGGADGTVLTKQSATDNDVAWEAVPGGGSAVPDYIYLDEKFATDTHGLYTPESGGTGALAYATVTDGDGDVRGYIYDDTLSAGVMWNRNDGHNGNIRDVLVAIEVEWQDNTGGTPVFSFDMRIQSDRFIRIQSHGTNIHIYTTAPGAADSLRANTAATYTAGRRGWIVGMVYQNQVFAWWGNAHPLMRLFAATLTNSSSASFDLAGDANFNTEANRTGRADRIRIATGSGGTANKQRILRHLIVDLDKMPVI